PVYISFHNFAFTTTFGRAVSYTTRPEETKRTCYGKCIRFLGRSINIGSDLLFGRHTGNSSYAYLKCRSYLITDMVFFENNQDRKVKDYAQSYFSGRERNAENGVSDVFE